MAKITLTDISDFESQSAVTTVNNNNNAIETAMENTLSRDGTTPNEMESDLDMNSNRIINLPEAIFNTEPVRRIDWITAANGGEIVVTPDVPDNSLATAKYQNDSVTNIKLANMPGDTIKGRLSTTGDPQDLTVAQVQTLLGISQATQNEITFNTKSDLDTFVALGVVSANIQTLRTLGYNAVGDQGASSYRRRVGTPAHIEFLDIGGTIFELIPNPGDFLHVAQFGLFAASIDAAVSQNATPFLNRMYSYYINFTNQSINAQPLIFQFSRGSYRFDGQPNDMTNFIGTFQGDGYTSIIKNFASTGPDKGIFNIRSLSNKASFIKLNFSAGISSAGTGCFISIMSDINSTLNRGLIRECTFSVGASTVDYNVYIDGSVSNLTVAGVRGYTIEDCQFFAQDLGGIFIKDAGTVICINSGFSSAGGANGLIQIRGTNILGTLFSSGLAFIGGASCGINAQHARQMRFEFTNVTGGDVTFDNCYTISFTSPHVLGNITVTNGQDFQFDVPLLEGNLTTGTGCNDFVGRGRRTGSHTNTGARCSWVQPA